MIGLLYLLLCFSIGWVICSLAFPKLGKITETAYDKRKITFSPYLLYLPAWYVTGTLAMTWVTYLLAIVFEKQKAPLLYSNSIVIPIAILITVAAMFRFFKFNMKSKIRLFTKDKKVVGIELILLAAILALACILMWTTFFISGNRLYVGVSVFSDFSPHIGMIRSFSYGNNFPTAYSHFAGEDIRYHFLFQFLAGNLEFLGLRLDYAFNLPSIISFVSAFLLLYLMALKISGKIGVGILACLFFAFRSSKALFTFLSQVPQGTGLWDALQQNTEFIGDTPNENWGLWNLNVYCNQRHLAFGLSVIFLVIIMLLPHLFEMFEDIKNHGFHLKEQQRKDKQFSWLGKLLGYFRVMFFTKEGWFIKDLRLSIATGILLGSLAFFHGAAVIGCLSVLFVIAILSRRRLEFLIIAVITVTLSTLQTHFFIHGSVVSTKLLFGFIAENKTLVGVADYLDRLLGILPIVILAAFCLEKGVGRYLILAFTAPLIFALTISLTIDVTVNHKYIMISCILLGIYAASLIIKLLERRDILLRVIGIFLILLLTSTGIYDFATVLKKNTPNNAIVLNMEDPITQWINENSTSQDIFLTANYALNQVVLGGAMLYQGWPYFAWSAGYDTNYRDVQVKRMYEAATPDELDLLVKENRIRFIIVDNDNRKSTDYIVNEDNIRATYQCVKEEGEGEWKISIYDTEKRVK